MNNRILVANIGSTSFKFQLLEMPQESVIASGRVEKIGSASSPWKVECGGAEKSGETLCGTYHGAIALCAEQVREAGVGDFAQVRAFAFKPVMAKGISGTQLLDERILQAMEALNTLLPAHNPAYIHGVRSFQEAYAGIPCIGTFETAFFDQMPEVNRLFPVPTLWRSKFGIERTGFHGASHRFVTERTAVLIGSPTFRLISCHLGGSSSIAAIKDGVAINSSWGMTAQSGLPQNNRSGDFDVFAAIYLMRDCGLGLDEVERILSKESGLKGVSGCATGDLRDIKNAAESGSREAQLALDLFVATIRRFIGQFILELNGIDALVFTAGIGENNADLREAICADLDYIGLTLDSTINNACLAQEKLISAPASRVKVFVIPTNEEIIIARNAWEQLQNAA